MQTTMVACPLCHGTFRITDSSPVGKGTRCQKCGAPFTIATGDLRNHQAAPPGPSSTADANDVVDNEPWWVQAQALNGRPDQRGRQDPAVLLTTRSTTSCPHAIDGCRAGCAKSRGQSNAAHRRRRRWLDDAFWRQRRGRHGLPGSWRRTTASCANGCETRKTRAVAQGYSSPNARRTGSATASRAGTAPCRCGAAQAP
jgi:hypothetical protein